MIKNKKKLIAEEMPEFLEDLRKIPKSTKLYVDRSVEILGKIHDRLNELNMTQKDLADKLGISEEAVSQKINGLQNFRLKTICEIEVALKFKIIQIL